jgi:hypothetical protein
MRKMLKLIASNKAKIWNRRWIETKDSRKVELTDTLRNTTIEP